MSLNGSPDVARQRFWPGASPVEPISCRRFFDHQHVIVNPGPPWRAMRRVPTMFCVRSLPSNVRSAEHERHVPLQGIADQIIAAGIERIDAADPVISPDPTMNTVDH